MQLPIDILIEDFEKGLRLIDQYRIADPNL